MVSKRTSKKARQMMSETPGLRYQQALNKLRSETSPSTVQSAWFTALGIDNLTTFDPQLNWSAGEFDSHFRFTVGHQPDDPASVVDIDLAESSAGGTGPHVCIQGITGSGKSVLLSGLVLGACTRYSPSKLNFVLMDFKGRHTFRDLDTLPHVLANFSYMQERAGAVRQMTETIAAEIERREAVLTQYQVSCILDYRAKRAAAANHYPPLPELAVVVSEGNEFIREHDEFERLLGRLVTVGRALGIHLILCGQVLRQREFYRLMEHFTCRVSLRVGRPVHSQYLLDVDDAARLPIGSGAALMRTAPEDDLVAFNSFNSFELMPGEDFSGVRERDALLRRLHSYTVDDPGDRTLAEALADVEVRHPYQSR
jgi:S-DNA-T family DNA segregation ATPase FtsK/SpoIIIE